MNGSLLFFIRNRECVGGHIRACETATVECPFADDKNVKCDEPLKLSEVATVKRILTNYSVLTTHFNGSLLK